jgi:hypothetical protein
MTGENMKMRRGKDYTVNEVAKYCDLHYYTVWRAVKAKALSAHWDSQHLCWMIWFDDVLEWRQRVADRKRGMRKGVSEDE